MKVSSNSLLLKNYNEAFNEVKRTMEQCENRIIPENEINQKMRHNRLDLNGLQNILSKCDSEEERTIINSIYQPAVERVKLDSLDTDGCEPLNDREVWEKFFGFSLVLAESKEQETIRNGLYVGLHPICGPGGCAEVLGCYLTRPEQRMADEKVMIMHNHSIWRLQEKLNQ